MKFFSAFFLLVFSFTQIFAYCPDGATAFEGSCYYFRTEPDQYMYAGGWCSQNGYLASIHNGFANSFIQQQAAKTLGSNATDFWIGLFQNSDDPWHWQDQTALDFLEWAPSQPKEGDCASMNVKTGLWSSANCSIEKPFVCGLPYMKCPIGWNYFAPTNSCYGRDGWNVSYLSWADSEAFCQSQGGHSISFHDKMEILFITTMCTFCAADTWTGLYSDNNGTTWKWTDGSPADFLPWANNNYPLTNNGSTCVYTRYELLFNDEPCNSRNGKVMCKKPAAF